MILLKGVARVYFHLARHLLFPLEFSNPRLYMRLYVALLRRYGLRTDGEPRYIASNVRFDDLSAIRLGTRTVISKDVIMLTHDYSLTTALIALGDKIDTDVSIHREIVLGRNVFVGMGAILLPGCEIGDNVIVGAGSVVRGKVEGDSVVVGNPAQAIGSITSRADHWAKIKKFDSTTFDRH